MLSGEHVLAGPHQTSPSPPDSTVHRSHAVSARFTCCQHTVYRYKVGVFDFIASTLLTFCMLFALGCMMSTVATPSVGQAQKYAACKV